MVAFLAVLLALVVIGGVWYEVAARRARPDVGAAVAQRDREIAQLLEATDEGFLSFDADGTISAWSDNAHELFGWGADDVMGKRVTDTLIPVLHRKAYENGLANYRPGAESAIVGHRVEAAALHRDGHEIEITMFIWARAGDGFNAFVRQIPPTFAPESGDAAARPTIALTDPLTSLGNRQLLEKDLAVYEGQVTRYGLRSCIALIDIDDFKRFNDRYGREKGDEVIVAIAERLASRSRSGDSVYRVGGDEFICLLPEQTLETGAIAVDRMRRNIEELAIPDEDSPTGLLTVSAGLALLDAEHLKATAELLKDAEVALGRSRETGDVEQEGGESPPTT
jgi:diguanylate cyclase (GGDEF)-like protein/PAS domain S-box-containing protein